MKIKNFLPLFLIVIFSFFSIIPFLNFGFFSMHDSTQVERVFEMGKALRDGMFPVRWVEDLGYGFGYPLFNYYAPLPYYAGGFLNLLGIDPLTATKLVMVVAIIFSGISMYFLSKEFFGRMGGIISAVLYLYVPYHAVNVYVRGAFSEYFAYSIAPLCFLFLYKLVQQKNRKFFLSFSVTFASLVLSHNLTAFMVTPFLFVFLLFTVFIKKEKKIKDFLYFSLSFLLGLSLSAFYWIPAVAEIKYTNVESLVIGGSIFSDHFACISQLWSSFWGFGGSIPGCIDGLSFKLGKLHIALNIFIFLITLYFLFKSKIRNISNEIKMILLFFVFLIFSIFLTLSYSRPIWDIFPPMSFLQFPWRFLSLSALFSSLIAGSLIYFLGLTNLKYKRNIYAVVLFVILAIILLFYAPLFRPQKYLNFPSAYFVSDENIKWTVSEISDEYLSKQFDKPEKIDQIARKKILIERGSGKVEAIKEKTNYYEYNLFLNAQSIIKINLAQFPAWKIFLDNTLIEFQESDRGFLINIPRGNYNLKIRFEETPIERLSSLISIAGIVILLIGIIPKININKWQIK